MDLFSCLQWIFYYIFYSCTLVYAYIASIFKKNIKLYQLFQLFYKISLCVVYFFCGRKLTSGTVRHCACALPTKTDSIGGHAYLSYKNKNFIFTKKNNGDSIVERWTQSIYILNILTENNVHCLGSRFLCRCCPCKLNRWCFCPKMNTSKALKPLYVDCRPCKLNVAGSVKPRPW